jgi:hypothetical protein
MIRCVSPELFNALVNVSPTNREFPSINSARHRPIVSHSHLLIGQRVVVAINHPFPEPGELQIVCMIPTQPIDVCRESDGDDKHASVDYVRKEAERRINMLQYSYGRTC